MVAQGNDDGGGDDDENDLSNDDENDLGDDDENDLGDDDENATVRDKTCVSLLPPRSSAHTRNRLHSTVFYNGLHRDV